MAEFDCSASVEEAPGSSLSRLLVLAEGMPVPDRVTLRQLIRHQDNDLITLLQRYDAKELSIDEFNQSVVDARHAIYLDLFANISTEKAKQLVKSSVVADSKVSLTYGDIDFFSFCCILEKLSIKIGQVFVDLGHGTGRAIATAALMYGHLLSSCSGIEIVPELNEEAIQVCNRLNQIMASSSITETGSQTCDLRVLQGDILSDDLNWTEAGMELFS
jgi:hypothetical protein